MAAKCQMSKEFGRNCDLLIFYKNSIEFDLFINRTKRVGTGFPYMLNPLYTNEFFYLILGGSLNLII